MPIPSTQAPTQAKRAISRTPQAADSDETLIAADDGGKLGLVAVVAFAPSGLSSPTLTLKDSANGTIGTWPITAGETRWPIGSSWELPIDGDLVWQASSTDVTVSAWATRLGA